MIAEHWGTQLLYTTQTPIHITSKVDELINSYPRLVSTGYGSAVHDPPSSISDEVEFQRAIPVPFKVTSPVAESVEVDVKG